jgi:multiple sugar transport system substrate-binding protein
MRQRANTFLSRRNLLRAAGSSALFAGVAPGIVSSRARAQQKTLKIMQWKHFVPNYDTWFDETFVKQWGEQNDTAVIVDHVGLGDMAGLAAAEADAQKGHDLVMLVTPPPTIYEDKVIDHREIYEECARRYGNVPEFVIKSCYNPKTDKYFCLGSAALPAVMTYRKDLWDAVGATPDTWDDVRRRGRQIKLLHDAPVGFSLAPENNGEHTMRAILYSFGASVQDADGNPALKSQATLEAIKYVKALYEEAMTADMLEWDAASNNHFMAAGAGSLTLDTMSIVRAAESKRLPVANDLWVTKAPEGPAGRLAPTLGVLSYIIWNFAENVGGAKQFLVDYIGHTREGFLASGFQNMPVFPKAAPDLAALVANDAQAVPADKYAVLAEGFGWTTNMGHPGYANVAVSEVYAEGVIATMCAHAATGKLTPEEALDQADRDVRRIFAKWQGRGKV